MANGAPTVSNGLVISGVTTTSEIFVGNNIKLDPISGIVTATSFSGDGSNLTGIGADLVNDSSPQLGGNLDVNGKLIKFGDSNSTSSERLTFGNGDDIQVYYATSNLYITQATGDIILENTGTNTSNQIFINGKANTNSIAVHGNGPVELYDQSTGSAVKRLRTTSSGAVVTGILTATNLVSNQPSSHKNYIMNGKAMVFQRYLPGSMVTVNAGSNFYCMDRWYGRGEGSKGVFTFHQHDIQSQGQAAHAALRVNVTTTSTPSTDDVYKVAQRIEGRNIDGLGFGTSSAKTITLSFLTKSSVTGTHGGSIMNGAQNRAYPFTYTINSADTWEQKSITIPGDTSGTWSSGNDVGLEVNFDMGTAESNYRRPAGSWYAGRAEGADGTVQLITQSGGNWYATKIQLEEGNVATPFEHIPYPDELLRCKRYSFILGGGDTETYTTLLMAIQSHSNLCKAHVQFPVDMRSKDVTFSISGLTVDDDIASYSNGRVSSVNSENAGKSSATLIFNTVSMNNVNATRVLTDSTGGYIFCDCEL